MLSNLLQNEIATVSELYDLLLQEYAALQVRDLRALQQTTASKRNCTSRLHALIRQRQHYLLAQAIGTDAVHRKNHLESAEPANCRQQDALWAALKEVAIRAQYQNELNGAIITTSRGHVGRALTILHGRDPQGCLYDRGAQTTFGSSHRSLAKV